MTAKHHKRIASSRRRHLRNAALGHPATASGFIVLMAAFMTMWIVILRCFGEDDPYHWVLKHLETGDYAISQLEGYRQSNGGALPEGLDAVGFKNGGIENQYYIQLPGEGFAYDLEYIKLDDTSYVLAFDGHIWGRGQYVSTVGHWNAFSTKYNSLTNDYTIDNTEGEGAAKVYLKEFEIGGWYDGLAAQLSALIADRKGRREQYVLHIINRDSAERIAYARAQTGCDDSVCRSYFNCLLTTFDPTQQPEHDYFRDFRGYLMLDGKVCFIVDNSTDHQSSIVRRTRKGRLFDVDSKSASSARKHCWFLDIDRHYEGSMKLKGTWPAK